MNDIVTQPRIYLVSRPSVDFEQIAQFLDDEHLPPLPDSIRSGTDESSAVIETSARLCYMSFGRGRRDIADFITNLLRSKDGSVLEHVSYGLVFTGLSRSLTHELVRHRAGFAYSQRSQRYVDETEGSFVVPPILLEEGMESAREIFELAADSASERYAMLADQIGDAMDERQFKSATDRRKAVRQAARAILPNATETKIFATANVRAWRHFIEMRATEFADVEIRRLAIGVLRVLAEEAPLLFGDFEIQRAPDGSEIATPKYSKV